MNVRRHKRSRKLWLFAAYVFVLLLIYNTLGTRSLTVSVMFHQVATLGGMWILVGDAWHWFKRGYAPANKWAKQRYFGEISVAAIMVPLGLWYSSLMWLDCFNVGDGEIVTVRARLDENSSSHLGFWAQQSVVFRATDNTKIDVSYWCRSTLLREGRYYEFAYGKKSKTLFLARPR